MTRWLIEAIVKPALLIGAAISLLAGSRRTRRSPEPGAESTVPGPLWRLLKRWAMVAAGLVVLAGIAGVLVMVSGIVPIKASSGHWAVTVWLLDFAKSRSVATHTLGVEAPPLDDPALVLKGAGHFDFGCRPCHGSPAMAQPRVARAMTPRPPDLSTAVRDFSAEELFYIVKHGIKFTGMPAWPAPGRDDEVWAMVAFLQRLPDLDARSYERLIDESPPDPPEPMQDLDPQEVPGAVAASCRRCHGDSGQGRGLGAFPRLAGQRRAYLEASLRAYARGERRSGIMEPIAAGLEDAELRTIAGYYANLPPASAPSDATGEGEVALGESLALKGIPGQLVPPCAKCHGPKPGPYNPHYPRLSGQYENYLVLQLQLFKSQSRGGTAYHHLMHRVAGQLEEEQMGAVARYYASH